MNRNDSVRSNLRVLALSQCQHVPPTLIQCCFTSIETMRLIRDGEPRAATSTFTQLLSSVSSYIRFGGVVELCRRLWLVVAVRQRDKRKGSDAGLIRSAAAKITLPESSFSSEAAHHHDRVVRAGVRSDSSQLSKAHGPVWLTGAVGMKTPLAQYFLSLLFRVCAFFSSVLFAQ